MVIVPFKQPEGKYTEYSSVEEMTEHAKRRANQIVTSCDVDDDPLEVAICARDFENTIGGEMPPPVYWAIVLREVERLIEDYRCS